MTHEAQGPPLSCAIVEPAKVALQWSCHSVTAEADVSPWTVSSSPPSHGQLQVQCISGESEEATLALIPCLGRALSPGPPVHVPVQGVGL